MSTPNPDRARRLRELFDRAMELPTEQRKAFVKALTDKDTALARELLAMLRSATRTGDDLFARRPMGADFNLLSAMKSAASDTPRPPVSVGNYRILRALGEGGFGVVYLAEQAAPRREVALKIIRPSLSPGAMRRFADEARVLARLQHPGIAQVYEAGVATIDGQDRPYFAMEYVRGQPLHVHLQSHPLDTRDRLRLLAKICHAVQHAHQKGVVHRDLKPSNILVNEQGEPKILDFGVARLTDSDVQATRRTEVGQWIGTLEYMSPEQVAGDPDDLDTRSDVYALGVIGFELLAGRLPYDLSGKAALEAARVIREDEPDRLSGVSRLFRGDIETIIDKALAKDKDRRYSSASALAADLERFLNDEPIEARPASAWYQVSKFARRNKALVAGLAAAAISVTIATGSIVWAIGSQRVSAERERTSAARADASAANARAARAELLHAQVASSFSPEILAKIDAELAHEQGDDVPIRLLRVEVLDGLNRFNDARAEIAALGARTDLGVHRARVLLWHGDINITSAAERMTPKRSMDSIREAIRLGLPTAERLYAEALIAGNVVACRSKLELAVREDPRHLRAQNLLAFLEFICGDAAGALGRARAAETLAPKHPNPLIVQVIALTFLNRRAERDVVLERLEKVLDTTGFKDAKNYLELADAIVDLNDSDRPIAGIQTVITKVYPFILSAFQASGSAVRASEVHLRMPGFMAAEFSIEALMSELMPIARNQRDPAALHAFLNKLRALGPAVSSLIDARIMREAANSGDFATAARMGPDILAAPQLLSVNSDVSATYLSALHQLWIKDPTPENRARALAAVPILNKHWRPSASMAPICMVLAELGLPDEGRSRLIELEAAHSSDKEALRDIRYWLARLETSTSNPHSMIVACCRYLDTAPADDAWRAEVKGWLRTGLAKLGRLPRHNGVEQTPDDIRARYGLDEN